MDHKHAAQGLITAAEQLMIETMARYDCSHDEYHVRRVRKTALSIAQALSDKLNQRSPDLLVVELAALLHDVLDKKYVPEALYSDPYKYFLPFFQRVASEHGLDLVADGRAQTVAMIVKNVSWQTEKGLRQRGEWGKWHEECVELHCVQDADRLDAIGAFGIMRCAAYSAVTSQALHTSPGDARQATSAIQHFHDKLLHIHEYLKTEPGRRAGARRHKLMVDFLEAVENEYNADVQ